MCRAEKKDYEELKSLQEILGMMTVPIGVVTGLVKDKTFSDFFRPSPWEKGGFP